MAAAEENPTANIYNDNDDDDDDDNSYSDDVNSDDDVAGDNSDDDEDDVDDDDEEEEEEEVVEDVVKKPESLKRKSNPDDALNLPSPSTSSSSHDNPSQNPSQNPHSPQNPNPNPSAASAAVAGASPPPSAAVAGATATASADSSKRQKIASGADESRRLFQRLWTDDDEILLLQGFLDFTSQRPGRGGGGGGRGGATNHDTAPFYDQIRTRLQLDFNKNQLVEKLRRLKKKYRNTVNRIGSGRDFSFKSPHEQAAFELSRKIWSSSDPAPHDDDDDAGAEKTIPKRRGRKKIDDSPAAPAPAAAAAVTEDRKPCFPHVATPVATPVSNVIEETVRSCLSPLFKELLYSAINGPSNLAIGAASLNPLPLNFLNFSGSDGGVADGRWRKQQILELEAYSKRLELVQEQIKMTLEELKSNGS